jgi:hypothetical protein
MVLVVSLTKALALDCEMVGVGAGGSKSALARVTLVSAIFICLVSGEFNYTVSYLIASYAVAMVNPCDIWGFVVEIKMERVKDLCNLETTAYILYNALHFVGT